MKAEGREMCQTLSYQFSILCLGSRGMGEHHCIFGGYSRHEMIGMISSFLERVNGRMTLHCQMKYTHPVEEKVKSFVRHGKANLQMDNQLGNLQM